MNVIPTSIGHYRLERELVRARTLLLATLLVVFSCGRDRVTKPRAPVIGSDVVFVTSHADYLEHLYVANIDGTGLTRLTTDSAGVLEPQLSPDGSRILFLRWYGPGRDSLSVTVIEADGTNLVRLTQDRSDNYPTWSPDGTKIAYERNADSPTTRSLWVMNADGSGQHMLYSADSLYGADEFSWATKDYLIGGSFFGLYRIRADGSGIEQFFSGLNFSYYWHPRMAPDGRRIAFSFQPADSSVNIYTVKADGTDLKQITTGSVGGYPEWSPDGARIGYFLDAVEWWCVNADGSNPARMPISDAYPEASMGWDWK